MVTVRVLRPIEIKQNCASVANFAAGAQEGPGLTKR